MEGSSRGPFWSRPGVFAGGIGGAGLWTLLGAGVIGLVAASVTPAVAVAAVVAWLLPPLVASIVAITSSGPIWVGADGIRDGGRFLPYSDLAEVTVQPKRIVLRTKDGQEHHIQLLHSYGSTRWTARAQGSHVAEALTAAFERSRRAREVSPLEEDLAQGPRSLEGWLAALEALASQIGEYREASLDRDGLLALVADAGAEPTARAGAAWLLRRTGSHADERARFAEVAEATAHPQVRVMLDAASDEALEPEVLDRALRGAAPKRAAR